MILTIIWHAMDHITNHDIYNTDWYWHDTNLQFLINKYSFTGYKGEFYTHMLQFNTIHGEAVFFTERQDNVKVWEEVSPNRSKHIHFKAL